MCQRVPDSCSICRACSIRWVEISLLQLPLLPKSGCWMCTPLRARRVSGFRAAIGAGGFRACRCGARLHLEGVLSTGLKDGSFGLAFVLPLARFCVSFSSCCKRSASILDCCIAILSCRISSCDRISRSVCQARGDALAVWLWWRCKVLEEFVVSPRDSLQDCQV